MLLVCGCARYLVRLVPCVLNAADTRYDPDESWEDIDCSWRPSCGF